MTTVIDDHLVREVVLGRPIDVIGPMTTTTHWWWRLALSVRRGVGGPLSRPILELSAAERALATATIDDLDGMFDIVDFRAVLRLAADLAVAQRVNLLAAEALAVCVLEDAGLAVGIDSPPLARAAGELGVRYAVV